MSANTQHLRALQIALVAACISDKLTAYEADLLYRNSGVHINNNQEIKIYFTYDSSTGLVSFMEEFNDNNRRR